MSTSRKCPDCQTWNDDRDYCSNCGKLLNYELQVQKEEQEKKKRLQEMKLDKVDAWLARLKESNNFFSKILYYCGYSMWVVLVMIITFIYAVIAFVAG